MKIISEKTEKSVPAIVGSIEFLQKTNTCSIKIEDLRTREDVDACIAYLQSLKDRSMPVVNSIHSLSGHCFIRKDNEDTAVNVKIKMK